MKHIKLREFCEMCDGDGADLNNPLEEMDDAGKPLFVKCGFCNGTGSVPTKFGLEILQFLKEQLPEMWDTLKKLK